MLGLLSVYINRLGFLHFATRYLGPYLIVNFWLIFYTFLQHTDKSLPHYEESGWFVVVCGCAFFSPDFLSLEWNFVRGALATIDRPYHVFDFFHHEIGTSRKSSSSFLVFPFFTIENQDVLHHFFSRIPHYYAAEATLAIKPILGKLETCFCFVGVVCDKFL
jgi:fatty acid desaturase